MVMPARSVYFTAAAAKSCLPLCYRSVLGTTGTPALGDLKGWSTLSLVTAIECWRTGQKWTQSSKRSLQVCRKAAPSS